MNNKKEYEMDNLLVNKVEDNTSFINEVFSEKIHEKFLYAIRSLLLRSYNLQNSDSNKSTNDDLMFYGYFLTNVNIKASKKNPTAWVFVDRDGLQLRYNPVFIDLLTQEQIIFILLHECQHLLSKHTDRVFNRCPKISNIVMDQIINSDIISRGYKRVELPLVSSEDKLEILKKLNINSSDLILQVPDEYKDKLMYEVLYSWAKEEQNKRKQQKKQKEQQEQQGSGSGNGGQSQSSGEDQESQSGNNSDDFENGFKDWENDKSGKYNNMIDVLDNVEKEAELKKQWAQMSEKEQLEEIKRRLERGDFSDTDILTDSEVDSLTKDVMIDGILTKMRNRGLISSNVEEMLGKIRPSKIDYLKPIKKSVSTLVGYDKNNTYTRMNRRGLEGIKGFKKEGFGINVILDVSGSMWGNIENVLSHCFQNNLLLNVLQVDAEVQTHSNGKEVIEIKDMSELQRMKIKGLGGTVLQPGIDYFANHKKYKKFNTLILTDGYCDDLDVSALNKVVLISCGADINVVSNRRNYVNYTIPVEENEN